MSANTSEKFPMNIQINAKDIITLNKLCTKNTSIIELKSIILNERNLNDLTVIVLKYNNIIMENEKSLQDYNIMDSKHIIKLSFNVTESKEAGESEQNAFITHNSETNDVELPSHAQPKEPKCHQWFTQGCINCCQYVRDGYMNCYEISWENRYNLILSLFCVIFFVIYIGNLVGLLAQHYIYRKYIGSSTTEMLDYYCNNNGNEFTKHIGTDVLFGFIINITFIVYSTIFGYIYYMSVNGTCHIHVCFGLFGICVLITLYVAMAVQNSIILWEDITKIKKYCDPTTEFYQKMINTWSIWNYMHTFISYIIGFPFICGICCAFCNF